MTEQHSETQDEHFEGGPQRGVLVLSVVIAACFVALRVAQSDSSSTHVHLSYLIAQISLVSVVIWQACDPFADAAQWIGRRFHLPGSVRGATIDAVASSMPELFSGVFFVLLATSTIGDVGNENVHAAGAEGFGSSIATCAGSAVYNMILIPAFCALVISFKRPSRPTIDIEQAVITRDGMWFVGCSILLIVFLNGESMSWWMGTVLLAAYAAYVLHLYLDARHHRKVVDHIHEYLDVHGTEIEHEELDASISSAGLRLATTSTRLVRHQYTLKRTQSESGDEPPHETAGILFGYAGIPLNMWSCWGVIIASTLIVAGACYFLVESTLQIAKLLDVPPFFVAVILAAAASSVPDTLLAIGAARRGDDSGAVSNAFGSNIFDICICLSVPLFINSYLNGWAPVTLLEEGKPIPGLVGLRYLMMVLTVVTLAVMWHRRQLTRRKALFLCGLYLIFIGYAVGGSLGW
ncbi:MAG: sodium:calcium antiporter [Planctomycetaceae bacterium]|nr:sodium:calcium antiporter [Planctomycetaceae bacterium]